jgi:carboxylesterase type B
MNLQALVPILMGIAVAAAGAAVVTVFVAVDMAKGWMRKAIALEHQRDQSDIALQRAQERGDRLQRELRAETDRARRLANDLAAARQDNNELRAQIAELRGVR